MARSLEEEDDEERGGLIKRRPDRSWSHWIREGNLDTLSLWVPLVVLGILSVVVVAYNSFKDVHSSEWDACDESKPMAKHFYCHNASKPPGFHLDTPNGRLG